MTEDKILEQDRCFAHTSILLDQCITSLNIKADGIYVDCTTGGAGHSSAIFSQLNEYGTLICFDKDLTALSVAKLRLDNLAQERKGSSPKVHYIHSDFSNIREELEKIEIARVDGVLADLGVSSYQLDEATRGFSYQKDGPLDMRMDASQVKTAATWLNSASLDELTACFRIYGEERYSSSIARAIINFREQKELKRTHELVDLIYQAIPFKARKEKQHPAKRVFQAIRIEVNQELYALEKLLANLPSCINEDGRVVFLSFHSLEDRIIKHTFKVWENPCTCPKFLPLCQCQKKSLGRIVDKGKLPDKDEVEANHRSRSARIRSFHFRKD